MLSNSIKKLVQYGIQTGLTPECERVYTTNLLLDLYHEDEYEDTDCDLSGIVLGMCSETFWTKHAAAESLKTASYTAIYLILN